LIAADNAAAERTLILMSAGTADRRRTMGRLGAEIAAQVDWARLAESLRARKLLSSLGPNVVELAGGQESVEFTHAVDEAITTGHRHASFLQLLSTRAIGMLGDAGIRAATLKGPVLGQAIYGDIGRRLSSDIDLLVAPEQLNAAVEVIRGLGYAAPADHVEESGLPMLHFVLVHEGGDLPAVELHWRVHWYERSFARDRLLPPDINPAGDWRPERAAELVALLLFYARDGFAGLRLASDLSAWWDVCGRDLPAGAVPDVLSAYPKLERAVVAATRAAEETVGLPAGEILGRRSKVTSRERIAARLADPSPVASESQLYADMGLIDGLLMPPGGFRAFVRRQLLPPAEVLDEHSRAADRSRARSPAARCVGVLARYCATLARLTRAPERPPRPD